ncbi:MAG: hypothetical protein U9N78_03780 [Actinomycetota bacterium]|nr:hypothetical protein [Actinomycetota bacterium]
MNERGSMLPYLGALFFIGFVVLGLALDTSLLAATYREAAFAADAGAEAGAAHLEVSSVYEGTNRLERGPAITAAETASLAARSRSGRTAAATTDGTTICVAVTDRFEPRILGSIGIGTRGITVRACASPRQG